ncbi:MAG TPA: mycofactocin oligosaccharide methyltransferase MftM [Nocardioides sp.]|nr:mycofactocin oligosaccharide methyltransferase MftM [Nocardioides sp.]
MTVIDPLAVASPGRYRDDSVEVVRGGPVPAYADRTDSFACWRDDGRVHLVHELPAEEIHNDLAGRVATELFAGRLAGSELFERLLTGIVVSSAPDPLDAWESFYRNTLRLLGDLLAHEPAPTGEVPAAEGSLAGYAPVYRRARSLVGPGTVLELGSCFGFLSLLLASEHAVTASDLTANTVRLLGRVASRLGTTLDTLVCDAAEVPRPDRSYDTVVALHLLEHLEPDVGAAVVAEMQRLAEQRVVVAVPFEDVPSPEFGHVRVFTLADLADLGAASGWDWRVEEHHGGWLVLDRPSPNR